MPSADDSCDWAQGPPPPLGDNGTTPGRIKPEPRPTVSSRGASYNASRRFYKEEALKVKEEETKEANQQLPGAVYNKAKGEHRAIKAEELHKKAVQMPGYIRNLAARRANLGSPRNPANRPATARERYRCTWLFCNKTFAVKGKHFHKHVAIAPHPYDCTAS